MSPDHQTLIISELHRLEVGGCIGLLGVKYLSSNLTTPDLETGHQVTFIN